MSKNLPVEVTVKIQLTSNSSDIEIMAAIRKGIYMGLDIKNVSAPKDVSMEFLYLTVLDKKTI